MVTADVNDMETDSLMVIAFRRAVPTTNGYCNGWKDRNPGTRRPFASVGRVARSAFAHSAVQTLTTR